MTSAPRTQLNRLLLSVIGLMTLAIFGLAAAIIWKLFLAGGEEASTPGLSNLRTLQAGESMIEYRVPDGCVDSANTSGDSIVVTFAGETCGDRKVETITGNVSIEVE